MNQDEKLQKPDWFNIKNYKNPSYLDPGFWAYQLRFRQGLLFQVKEYVEKGNEIDKKSLDLFDSIKEKGLLGLEWNFPDLSLKAEGIVDAKSNINMFDNSALEYAEHLREKQLEENLITNTVSVLAAYEISDLGWSMKDELQQSVTKMKSLISGPYREITETDKKDIKKACQHYPTKDNFNGLSYFSADLNVPIETLVRDFKKVVLALKAKEQITTKSLKRSQALKLKDWPNNNIQLMDSGILPYLDLYIESLLINKRLIDSEANEFIFGGLTNYVEDKVKRTTKNLAIKMIQDVQIDPLNDLYKSQPSKYWKEKCKESV